MKGLGIAAKWLFILCLPCLVITSSLNWVANGFWLYEYGFEKYNVSQTTGLAQPELEKVARGLISYFNSDEEYIALTVVKDGEPFELFNQREVIHLKDVKGLIQLSYRLWLGTLIYVAVYAGVSLFWQRRKYWRRLAWRVVIGSGITLGLMLAAGLGAMLNFDWLFLQFHLLSFANEFWLLDPTKDYLIMLFPQGFFFDAARLIGTIVVGVAGALGGVAGGYLWRSKRGKRKNPDRLS